MNKNRISLQELVAYNNTPKARALVVKYGYEPARDYEDLIDALVIMTQDYKEEAVKDLVKLHPHKDMIIDLSDLETKSCACGGNHSSANGNNHGKGCKCPECLGYSNFEYAEEYIDFIGKKSNKEGTPMDKFNEYLPLIAVAGIFALAITAIGKKA